MAKFETGQTYATRSACDHNCIFSFEIISRTAQFAVIKGTDGKQSRRKIHVDSLGEWMEPLGRYSMAPSLRAADDLVKPAAAAEQQPKAAPLMNLDNVELATILAGLRMIQRSGVPTELEDVATNGGAFEHLGDDDIDELCERLNRHYAEGYPPIIVTVSGGCVQNVTNIPLCGCLVEIRDYDGELKAGEPGALVDGEGGVYEQTIYPQFEPQEA